MTKQDFSVGSSRFSEVLKPRIQASLRDAGFFLSHTQAVNDLPNLNRHCCDEEG